MSTIELNRFVVVLIYGSLVLLGDVLRTLKIKTGLSSKNMKALRIDNFYSNYKSVVEL
jgi:hypothetical protein